MVQYNISIEQRMDLQMTGLFAAETGQLFRVGCPPTVRVSAVCKILVPHVLTCAEACATHFYDPLVAIYETASSSGDTKTSISYTCAKRTISSHMQHHYELFGICQLLEYLHSTISSLGAMTNYSLLPLFLSPLHQISMSSSSLQVVIDNRIFCKTNWRVTFSLWIFQLGVFQHKILWIPTLYLRK